MTTKEAKRQEARNRIHMRRNRRKMLTFVRMCRYGVNNFSRNAWLTIAATAVMSITLLIVLMTLSARNILLDTVQTISNNVDMSLYLKSDTSADTARELQGRLERLDNVNSVTYRSSDQARDDQIQQSKGNPEAIEALKQASNKLPATLRVSLKDINDTSSLDSFVKNDDLFKQAAEPNTEPSFRGDRRQAIQTIANWVRLAEIGGGVATIVFVVISSLVVFNTIRMAIFNRKDEIQMMKLIGAERNFIRGPFIVEAVMYGFIAALIATGVGVGLLYMAREPLAGYGLPITGTVNMMTVYIGVVLLGMILLGALIGIVSSWIATRKYLKI